MVLAFTQKNGRPRKRAFGLSVASSYLMSRENTMMKVNYSASYVQYLFPMKST